MERKPEFDSIEQKEKAPRRITDPGTFEAIAMIEGPEWVSRQKKLAEGLVHEANYRGSFQEALDRYQQGKPSTIRGVASPYHWLVDRDGTIRFNIRQGETLDPQANQELIDRVRALGFEIHS